MKHISILIFIVGLYNQGICQVSFKDFFDEQDSRSDPGGCFYYKVGLTNKVGFYQDTVKSFFCKSNLLRSIEVYDDKGNRNGLTRIFYPSGQLKEKVAYRDGFRLGASTTFYKNGKIQMNCVYPDIKNVHTNTPFKYLIVNYFDSLGNFQVKNLKGFCNYANFSVDDFDIIEKGKIVNGLRDSIWSGYRNDTLLFTEEYSVGRFLKGTRYDHGQETTYESMEKEAEFPGGINGLSNFLVKTMRYPMQAKRMGVDGKVFTQFIVDTDGSISDIRIIKSIMKELDNESIRVVSLMPKWIPGTNRGIPVKSLFVLPLTFKLDL